eukprot:TRINITY_DN39685_c0_g1_i1.p1 TRINITY_DN39685_c0_g1~~TRINITY_DN39685_c0_g1_i1.p1  ORF type:complete len:436 (-),score=22.78 TRINITY_DN39685_c0_g1_i1:58-1365(-)
MELRNVWLCAALCIGSLLVTSMVVLNRAVEGELSSHHHPFLPSKGSALLQQHQALVKAPSECPEAPLDRAFLERSIALGTRYMMRNQRKEGNFVYERDWRTNRFTPGDSPVRQAGACWGLALLYREGGNIANSELRTAVNRCLQFFNAKSRHVADGRRIITYSEDADDGKLGTLALVALAHIDYLLASPTDAHPPDNLQRYLSEYIRQIAMSQDATTGLFYGSHYLTGIPFGEPSSYSDGEALLALTKAWLHLGSDYSYLESYVRSAAESGFRRNVLQAREINRDSPTTKGYYQWSSMAYHELWLHAPWTADEKQVWAQRLMELADWIINEHKVLGRSRNTGYAFEGIIPAWSVAVHQGDDRSALYGCAIRKGIRRITAWQLGHPSCTVKLAGNDPEDDEVGGVQNHGKESLLRIDTVQHQMHAILYALNLLKFD